LSYLPQSFLRQLKEQSRFYETAENLPPKDKKKPRFSKKYLLLIFIFVAIGFATWKFVYQIKLEEQINKELSKYNLPIDLNKLDLNTKKKMIEDLKRIEILEEKYRKLLKEGKKEELKGTLEELINLKIKYGLNYEKEINVYSALKSEENVKDVLKYSDFERKSFEEKVIEREKLIEECQKEDININEKPYCLAVKQR